MAARSKKKIKYSLCYGSTLNRKSNTASATTARFIKPNIVNKRPSIEMATVHS
jgi:hypothetical protein